MLRGIQTLEYRCFHCGRPNAIPVPDEYSNPAYVMEVAAEQKRLRTMFERMGADLMELAGECVEAGVRPSILRRADELRALLKDILKRLQSEQENADGP